MRKPLYLLLGLILLLPSAANARWNPEGPSCLIWEIESMCNVCYPHNDSPCTSAFGRQYCDPGRPGRSDYSPGDIFEDWICCGDDWNRQWVAINRYIERPAQNGYCWFSPWDCTNAVNQICNNIHACKEGFYLQGGACHPCPAGGTSPDYNTGGLGSCCQHCSRGGCLIGECEDSIGCFKYDGTTTRCCAS